MTDFYDLGTETQAERLTVLARKSLEAWGVMDCVPRLIKYRENAVFEVVTPAGAPAALRVHRQGYHDAASLESELAWMSVLAEGGLTVPQPVPTATGALLTDARAADVPGVWQVDMLSWLNGRELGEIGEPLDLAGYEPEAIFTALGQTIARLHSLSAAWPEQMRQPRHAWDRDGLVGERPLWGDFWNLAALTPDQKDLVLRAKAAIAEDLDTYGQSPQTYGLIHADLVPENVMLNGDQIALIDFDDAGYGWHMFEIVTALYWLSEEPAFDRISAALLEGYQSVRPLSEADLAMMDLFFAARSLTYLGWVHTRSETETAKELTPIMIEIAEALCSAYLESRNQIET